LAAVRAAEREARARGAAAVQQSARLRAQLDELRAGQASASGAEAAAAVPTERPRTPTPSRAELRVGAKTPAPSARPRLRGATGRAATTARPGAPPLGELEGEGDDPIGGLGIDDR